MESQLQKGRKSSTVANAAAAARSRWRALAQDAEARELVVRCARAQRDADVAQTSLDAAFLAGMARLGAILQDYARRPDPHCVHCGAATARAPRSHLANGISWQCCMCPASVDGGVESITASLAEVRAFWEMAPRLRFGHKHLAWRSGEEQVVLTAHDTASGRGVTVAVASEDLAVRSVEVEQ